MATPDLVLELRRHVGHSMLWLSGCTAVVLRGRDGAAINWRSPIDPSSVEVLVVQRADNHAWTPVTGIIDPGEEPAQAACREILEETACQARVMRLLSVEVVGPVTYENGDQTTYLDVAFACEWCSGDPFPADGENTQTMFVPGDQVPQMNDRFTRTIARAFSGEQAADFQR